MFYYIIEYCYNEDQQRKDPGEFLFMGLNVEDLMEDNF